MMLHYHEQLDPFNCLVKNSVEGRTILDWILISSTGQHGSGIS